MKGPLLPIPPFSPVLCKIAASVGLLLLPACAGVIDRAEQPVTVFTDPPGAYCVLSRNGAAVGVITPSPGLLHVKNSKHHISVRCSKALHENETAVLVSSRRGVTIGDIVVKGMIGLAVDAGTGASHEYPSSITLFLAAGLVRERGRTGTAITTVVKAKVTKDAAACNCTNREQLQPSRLRAIAATR